jgi:hypothetical protein
MLWRALLIASVEAVVESRTKDVGEPVTEAASEVGADHDSSRPRESMYLTASSYDFAGRSLTLSI